MIEPMRISRIPDGKENLFPGICASGEYFAELKKDGYWYQYEKQEDRPYFWSRNVSKVTGILTEKSACVPHIIKALDCLPPKTVIIGEIYYPGRRSKDVTPIMGGLPETAIERQKGSFGWIHYYMHDIIYYNGINLMHYGAWVRYKILEAVWNKYNLNKYKSFLELAAIVEDNIQEACAEALAMGEEGMVLKKRTAPYTPGKRPAWDTLKIKKTDTCDAVIMGVEPPTVYYDGKLDVQPNYKGKDANEWPYWAIYYRDQDPETLKPVEIKKVRNVPIGKQETIEGINFCTRPITKAAYYGWSTAIRIGAYDETGKLVSIGTVSSGLSDKDKENLSSYIGQVCELAGMEKDCEAHTLRHFHFVKLREDKNPLECSLKSIFN